MSTMYSQTNDWQDDIAPDEQLPPDMVSSIAAGTVADAARRAMTEEQGWLFMGVLKKVRSQQGAFRLDNYEDDAAYTGLRAEAAQKARGGEE